MRRSLNVLPAAILMVIVAVAYARTASEGFVWDDDLNITANPTIKGPLGFADIWTGVEADNCPLTKSAFWALHRLFGDNAGPYHIFNVLVHGICALLLWAVLRKLGVPGAWFGAAIWAVHPVMVESVAWVTELKNTLSGMFLLPALWFFIDWIQHDTDSIKKNWSWAPCIGLCALAIAAKASATVAPLIMILAAWAIRGQVSRRVLRVVIPVGLVASVSMAVTAWSNRSLMTLLLDQDPRWIRLPAVRAIEAGRAIWFYIGKLLWPHPLMAIYHKWNVKPQNPLEYIPLVGVPALLAALYFSRQSIGRWPFFVFASFVTCLLPVLGLVDQNIFRNAGVFDHFQYLASMVAIPAFSASVFRAANWMPALNPTVKRWLPVVVSGLVTVALAATTIDRVPVYQSQQTLWNDTAKKNPDSWVAWYYLGCDAEQKGQHAEAMADFERALKVNPVDVVSKFELAGILARSGRLAEAEAHYRGVVSMSPRFTDAQINLGITLGLEGRWAEAADTYEHELKSDPFNIRVRNLETFARARALEARTDLSGPAIRPLTPRLAGR